LNSGNIAELYEGQLINGKKHGHGNLTFSRDDKLNRDYYVGKFKDDKSNGKGKLVWKSGSVYEGEFVNGLRFGNGTYTLPNGEMYEGQWFNNKKNGFGKYTFARNSVKDNYIGELKDNEAHGKGKLVWKDGSVYEG